MIFFIYIYVINNMFSMNTQLQNRNMEMVKANNRANKNINKMQHNLNELNSNINKIKPSSSGDAIKRDELNELYEFLYKYDGTLGETALLFRENVKNYAEHVYNNAGNKYNEARILTRVIKSFTGDAQIKYSSRQGQRFNNLDEFYEWFDPEFQLNSLRKELHKKLSNWEIAANTQDRNIVRDYKKKLNLFNLTTATSTRALINDTLLPTATQITSIIKSTQFAKPEIYRFIDNWIMRNLDSPQTLSELDGVIKAAVKYIETKGINSNESHTDPTKISSVNAIQAENYSQFSNPNLISQYTNSSQRGGGFRGNYNQRSQYNRGNGFRGNYSQRGQPGTGFRGNYSQRAQPGNGFRGNYRGSYSTRGRGRGRGQSNRSQSYRGRGRGRGRGQSNRGNNNNYSSRGFNRNYGQRQFFDANRRSRYNNIKSVPYYKPAVCSSCKIWGHAPTQCQWIHDDFPDLVEEYRKMGNRDVGNKNRSVNVTQTQQKQSKEQRMLGDDSDN